MKIEAGFIGVGRVRKLFIRMEAIDISGDLEKAGAILLNRIRSRFLKQTDPDGKKWPESEAAKERRASGRDGGTLFDTGTLFRSIQLFKISDTERSIGTDVPYAGDHQFGKDLQRVFLGFANEDIDVVVKLLEQRIRTIERG